MIAHKITAKHNTQMAINAGRLCHGGEITPLSNGVTLDADDVVIGRSPSRFT